MKSLYSGAEVGCHVLALLLHRQRALKTRNETTRLLDKLLEARGGIRVFLFVRDAVGLYQDAREAERELKYVYWIVGFLCRCKEHGVDASKSNIETAKEYIAQWAPEGRRTYGVSKIEKIWLKFKKAAPYIFGFYSYFRGLRRDVGSPDRLLDSFEKLASDEQLLQRLIGKAAYAADILAELARDVQRSDFTDVPRVKPRLRSFSSPEKDVIDRIDRKAVWELTSLAS